MASSIEYEGFCFLRSCSSAVQALASCWAVLAIAALLTRRLASAGVAARCLGSRALALVIREPPMRQLLSSASAKPMLLAACKTLGIHEGCPWRPPAPHKPEETVVIQSEEEGEGRGLHPGIRGAWGPSNAHERRP